MRVSPISNIKPDSVIRKTAARSNMAANYATLRPMRRSLGVALVMICVASALVAAGQGLAVRPSRVIDSEALLRDLKVLSADDMQGRQVGTPGGAKAREY